MEYIWLLLLVRDIYVVKLQLARTLLQLTEIGAATTRNVRLRMQLKRLTKAEPTTQTVLDGLSRGDTPNCTGC